MVEHLLTYGYLLVFLGSALEGEATYITAAYLAHAGHLNIYTVFGVAVAANVISTQAFYEIARRSGKAAFERKMQTSPTFNRVYGWVKKRGDVLVLLSRFLYGLRIAIPAACGAVGMGSVRFFVLNVAGGLAWGVVFGAIGYGLAGVARAMLAEMRESYEYPLAIGIFFTVALLLMLARDWHASRTLVRHPLSLGPEALEEVGHLMPEPQLQPHRHAPHRHHPAVPAADRRGVA